MNLYNSEHKATNPQYRDNYDRVFKKKVPLNFAEAHNARKAKARKALFKTLKSMNS